MSSLSTFSYTTFSVKQLSRSSLDIVIRATGQSSEFHVGVADRRLDLTRLNAV